MNRHLLRLLRLAFLFAVALMLAVGWDFWMNQPHQQQTGATELETTELNRTISLSPDSASDRLLIYGDTNRDGVITSEDVEGRDTWSWTTGGLLLANVDDDDWKGYPDWQDQVVNGSQDAEDLARVKVNLPEEMQRNGNQVFIKVEGAARSFVHIFQLLPDAIALIDVIHPTSLVHLADVLELGIEAKHFAHQNWDGFVDIRVIVRDTAGTEVATDQTRLRVAPWVMLPNSASTTDVYVSAGAYENETMRTQLQEQLQHLGATLHEYTTDWWEEMWMQDTMEIGYQEIPGHPRMHVVLRANRDADRYPPTLLAPGMGYITVGESRDLAEGDHLVDWLGNLEVSHPVPEFPLGRIYYGRNGATGVELQSEIVRFLEMQQVQSPVWVDTSWLAIKHVDEIFNFVPGPNGEAYLLINNAAMGIEQVENLDALGAGNLDIGYPPFPVSEALNYIEINQQIQQERLDPILEKAKQDFHLTGDRIIQLPLLYSDVREAYGLWSNSVNSIYVNGTVIAGDPLAPPIEGQDSIQRTIQQQFDTVQIPVQFVDDWSYQENKGNVHCATNTRKEPVVADVWQNIPAG
ncbi:protein-arginine deiminase family protein [Egbenema bharatensis]|uniref:protein-arginine deiminase family protein n=1 Tax=Egbenema bharatensis TaxID=3463334 RepID=UPI003A8B43F4